MRRDSSYSTRLLFTLALLSLISCGQRKTNTEGDQHTAAIQYPGSSVVSDSAVLFAPGLVSTDSFEHSAPAFSPDGKMVLWSIMEMPSYKTSILAMEYENGNWSASHAALFSDSSASDVYPTFCPDGKTLYFSSSRKLPSGEVPAKGNVLWKVEKTDTGWSVPQPLDSTISKGGDYASSVSANGNLYFTHGPFRSPDWNIMAVENTTTANQKFITLPLSINSAGYEDGPFIAPDESYLIFESDRPGGIDGSIDLYISFKSSDGNWTDPVNMGDKVNSSATERFAKVSPDGKYLFFGSNRRQVKGKPNFDIYWIDAAVIDELKSK